MNINEINITTTGSLSEFRKAQANLQANIAAGRGATFAYTGAAGHLAAADLPGVLQRRLPAARPATPTNYTGTNWTNATYLGFLAAMNPNPFGFASVNTTNGFVGNARSATTQSPPACRRTTSWRTRTSSAVTANDRRRQPDDQLRRHAREFGADRIPQAPVERLRVPSQLHVGERLTCSSAIGFQKPLEDIAQAGQTGNVQHAVKGNWLYELPFGKDQRWGGNATGLVDALIGGW